MAGSGQPPTPTPCDAVALAEETGWQTELPNSLVVLAAVEAGMGRTDSCREHAARAITLGRKAGVGVIEAHAADRARAARARRRRRAGGRHGTWSSPAASRPSHGLGDPVLLNWAGDLVEALDRAAEPERARGRVRGGSGGGGPHRSGPPSPPVAARCRGLLAEDGTGGRRGLRRGAALAPRGRPSRSRRHGPGCSTVSCCGGSDGAPTHAPSCGRRLTSSSGLAPIPGPPEPAASCGPPASRPGPRGGPGQAELTPQELRVALVVSRRARPMPRRRRSCSCPPKTVEYHLSSVYRKLGIRSTGPANVYARMRPVTIPA